MSLLALGPGRDLRVACGRLQARVQRSHERNEGGYFCRFQVLSVSWHVAASLENLANELVFGESVRHPSKIGAAFTSRAIEAVAVATLFGLN